MRPPDVPACHADDVLLAGRLFAIDPAGTGVSLRGAPSLARERWLAHIQSLLPPATSQRRLPCTIREDRLIGGLDLAATIGAGRRIVARGLLAESDGGILLLAMCERMSAGMAAHLGAAMDHGEVIVEREGIAARHAARFGVIALDEGYAADEHPPAALTERLAFHLDLNGLDSIGAAGSTTEGLPVERARIAWRDVSVDDAAIEAICTAATTLGISTLRAPLQAVHVARLHAALHGRRSTNSDDAIVAGRLVLGPRARILPSEPPPPSEAPEREDTPEAENRPSATQLGDMLVAAAKAKIPPGLLEALCTGAGRGSGTTAGRKGVPKEAKRGRPVGSREGLPGDGRRIDLLGTLRSAAPWQRLRQAGAEAGSPARLRVDRGDFRVVRFKQRSETTTIFVVDASGSSAMHRLAEAKGAVELLLSECYVRRDRVAMIAFRGAAAELLLPPTHSLARTKRILVGLAGGGGTPLAAGLDTALVLADAVRRKGQAPSIVVLTDGRANICRDGTAARGRAQEDAMAAAGAIRSAGMATLLIDTSPRPQAFGRQLAEALKGRYLPLPAADAASVSLAVKIASV